MCVCERERERERERESCIRDDLMSSASVAHVSREALLPAASRRHGLSVVNSEGWGGREAEPRVKAAHPKAEVFVRQRGRGDEDI